MNITAPIGIFLIALPVLAIADAPKTKSAATPVAAENQRIEANTLSGFVIDKSETFGRVITLEGDDGQFQNVNGTFPLTIEDPVVSDAYGVVKPLS